MGKRHTDKDDMDRKRITSDERDALMALLLIGDMSRHYVAKLLTRIQSMNIRNAARDFGMLRYSAEHLCESILDTVPVEQLKVLENELSMRSYTIGAKGIANKRIREDTMGTFLTWNMLHTLIDTIDGECCMVCDKDIQQQRACKLRKCIDNIPNDAEDKPDKSCPYKWL